MSDDELQLFKDDTNNSLGDASSDADAVVQDDAGSSETEYPSRVSNRSLFGDEDNHLPNKKKNPTGGLHSSSESEIVSEEESLDETEAVGNASPGPRIFGSTRDVKKSRKIESSAKPVNVKKRKVTFAVKDSRVDPGAKKKKRRKKGSSFLIEEAEVGEDDEEEEEEYDEFASEAAEASIAERDFDFAQKRRISDGSNMRTSSSMLASSDAGRRGASHLETTIGTLERRYQDQVFTGDDVVDDMEGERDDYFREAQSAYSQHPDAEAFSNLLPDIQDAKLWLVKCTKSGCEKELCIRILQKFVAYRAKGIDLPIYSAFACDSLKGYIYIEADNSFKIREALMGMRNLQLSRDVELKIVPPKEMPMVFLMSRRGRPNVQKGEWVRIKRGPYANDLALVDDVDEQMTYVTVRVVPRINIEEIIELEKNGTKRNAMSKSGHRPLPKRFDHEEVENKGGSAKVEYVSNGCLKWHNMIFDESGFLIKKIKIDFVATGSLVNASFKEIQQFKSLVKSFDDESSNMTALSRLPLNLNATKKDTIKVGSKVEVVKGDLCGVCGTVESVAENSLSLIAASSFNISGVIEIQKSQAVNKFEIGETVRVTSGIDASQIGMITTINTKDRTAQIFSPSTQRTFNCALEDLISCRNDGTASTEESAARRAYSPGDLVQLSTGEIGAVCCTYSNESCKILTTEDTMQTIPLSKIAQKRNTLKHTNAVGNSESLLGINDFVTVAQGSLRGFTGKILQIYKQKVFVKLSKKLEDHGLAVFEAKCLKGTGTSIQGSGARFSPGASGLASQDAQLKSERGMGDEFGGASMNSGNMMQRNGRRPNFNNNPSSDNMYRNRRGGGHMSGGRFQGGNATRGRELVQGCTVLITRGELKGVQGKIQRIQGDTLLVQPTVRPGSIKLSVEDVEIRRR